MAFDEKINIEEVAHDYIDKGKVFEGYTLVLLQQIRNELQTLNEHLKKVDAAIID